MKAIQWMTILTVGITVIFLSAKGEAAVIDGLTTPVPRQNNMTLLERWQTVEKLFKNTMKQGVKQLLPVITERSGQANVSRECVKSLMHLISGMNDIKTWALKFLDASGKLFDGLLSGTISAPGAFEECLNIRVNSTRLADKGKMLFTGQYCNIAVIPPAPFKKKDMAKFDYVPEEIKEFAQRDTFTAELSKSSNLFLDYAPKIGVCVPSGCSQQDITNIVRSFGDQLGIQMFAADCVVKEGNTYTPLIIGVLACISILTFLLTVGTLIGIYIYYKKAHFRNTAIRILLAFNFVENFNKFKKTDTSKYEITSLHGLRFLTMTWIILNHTYLYTVNRLQHAANKVRGFISNFFFQIVVNGTLQTDLFFFLAGLLLVYVLLIKRKKNPNYRIIPWMYVVHRILRIYPTYALIILLTFILPLLGSGPAWIELANKYYGDCYKNMWANFLFINNFYEPNNMCMYHTWFIAAEFQLYVFSLIILLTLFKWRKAGVVLMFLFILSCMLYTSISTYINDYPPVMLGNTFDPDGVIEFASKLYIKPMTHAGPYGVGMLTGYLLATKPDLKISPVKLVAGWCIAIVFSTSTIYGTYRWNSGTDYTVVEAVIYSAFFRSVFCTGVAWMIITCATGHAGIINYILSWKIFIPLGRLTFLAYLLHPLIMSIYIGNGKLTTQTDHYIIIYTFLGHLCVSYGIGFVIHFLVELPFSNLETMLFSKPERKDDNLRDVNEKYTIKDFSNHEKNGDIPTVTLPNDVESGKL